MFSQLMKHRIKTGKGTIPLLTLLSIWSISAITSLPGLAISPILGKLDTIFSGASDLEIQMLTSLPSVLIIPAVLLSGKISESRDKSLVLYIGLSIFLACGVLYFFAKSMTFMIILSCVLGIGAGLIIPNSTALIADFFTGKYRVKQMGLSSGINNMTLVIATILAGKFATINWHLSFIVYLVPVIPLLLMPFLSNAYLKKNNVRLVTDTQPQDTTAEQDTDALKLYTAEGKKFNVKLLSGLVIIYFLMTLLVVLIAFNLPFVLQSYHFDSTKSGTMISLFFLAIMLPGFFISNVISWLKKWTIALSFLSVSLGFLLILVSKALIVIGAGAILVGLGYGIVQPIVYEKTSLAAIPKKTVFALALVMSANYLAICVCPFVVEWIQVIFNRVNDMRFPFWVNMFAALIIAVIAYLLRNKTLFNTDPSNPED
ncbi:MAG: MFS transporter [Marinifilaceae bacterium]